MWIHLLPYLKYWSSVWSEKVMLHEAKVMAVFSPSASSWVLSSICNCSAVWMRRLLQWNPRDFFISVIPFVWIQWFRKETFCIPYPFVETLQLKLIFSSNFLKFFNFFTFYHRSLSLTHHIWSQFLSSSDLEIVSLPHFLSSNQFRWRIVP